MQREHLGSRLGFILLSAGCAIGIGNVWKFPYITGQNGGAIFVIIYFACLILLGLPIMTMEFAMGRGAQKSPAKMYQEIAPKGSKWYIHGYLALAGNILVRQRGTHIHPGHNVGIGKDDTLFAKTTGIVRFERLGKDRKQVSVYPVETAAEAQ